VLAFAATAIVIWDNVKIEGNLFLKAASLTSLAPNIDAVVAYFGTITQRHDHYYSQQEIHHRVQFRIA
jgi:hypothetical protein